MKTRIHQIMDEYRGLIVAQENINFNLSPGISKPRTPLAQLAGIFLPLRILSTKNRIIK